ncbi:EAL domain-containing protein [Pseudopontixanthobacter vadosimaris]|uniref:EAL domain-containing protein n=1 Tax=Pseudopontixanthobacter vadosimaris TaxID=2726450 RepID=UPI001F0FB28F|nr:EAL domain-containing protein [Pseudopontixanthobacter vadosimaris]
MQKAGCQGCNAPQHHFDIAMAFQPIVNVESGRAFAYEALVRGSGGESAAEVLARVTPENRYAFDQQCRVAAIEGAVAAGILDGDAKLSINFLPNAVYSPLACIQLTLKTARATGLPTDRLIFEFTESEEMVDTDHVRGIIATYSQMGFGTAIDDFGAGYAGLGLLCRIQTDYLKLDMELTRGIDACSIRRKIVASMVELASALGITAIAEGIETAAELHALKAIGIRYVQGYLLAHPGFRCLPDIDTAALAPVPPASAESDPGSHPRHPSHSGQQA